MRLQPSQRDPAVSVQPNASCAWVADALKNVCAWPSLALRRAFRKTEGQRQNLTYRRRSPLRLGSNLVLGQAWSALDLGFPGFADFPRNLSIPQRRGRQEPQIVEKSRTDRSVAGAFPPPLIGVPWVFPSSFRKSLCSTPNAQPYPLPDGYPRRRNAGSYLVDRVLATGYSSRSSGQRLLARWLVRPAEPRRRTSPKVQFYDSRP
jgi:hypothetical protein